MCDVGGVALFGGSVLFGLGLGFRLWLLSFSVFALEVFLSFLD